ncbi:hypothetical protein ACTPOK_24075 [Streptomyces inhibens]|uniref:hypothetical protein n=1 Tax=Streptomyces inhibens TaxID=2293571 RepID=UPI00402AD838
MTPPARGPVLGIDSGHRDRAALERLVLEALQDSGCPRAVLLCTHQIRTGQAHLAASVELPAATGPAALTALAARLVERGAAVAGPDEGPARGAQEYRPGALEARRALLTRQAGRAVRFPGQDSLRGRLTIARALATGAVDRVDPLGTEVDPDTVVDTRDFVRPVFRDGVLVLEVTPAAGGTVIPLELRDQHICGH